MHLGLSAGQPIQPAMSTDDSTNPPEAWRKAQEALAAAMPQKTASISKPANVSPFLHTSQPWQQTQGFQQSIYPPYGYPGYPPLMGGNFYNQPPPHMNQLPPPHMNQPPPSTAGGVRFSLNTTTRFKSNQPRFQPRGPQSSTLPPPRQQAWRPRAPAPAPAPANYNSGAAEQKMDTDDTTPPGTQAANKRATPAATSANAFTPTAWPPAMRNWVTRCFATVTSEQDKDKMETTLKDVITDVFRKKLVDTINWDTYPIPKIHIPAPPMQGMQAAQTPVAGRGRGRGKRGRGSRWGPGSQEGKQPGKQNTPRPRNRSSSSDGSSRSRSRSSERASNYKSGRRQRTSSRNYSESGSSDTSSSYSNADFIPLNSKLSKKIWKKELKTKKGGANSNKKRKGVGSYKMTQRDRQNIQKRAARFGDVSFQPRTEPLQLSINSYADEDGEDVVWDENHKIVGTCQNIEKEYLRLTSAPSPADVRPVIVLMKSLEHVKAKWLEKSDYRWTCDQFKSIRQDLTVQCIRDVFTAKVYETHARVALEASDHCEFNQCQTQLKMLYSEGVDGSRLEFTAYRILYYVFTTNTIDMIQALASLTAKEKEDPCIKFALDFRSAWSLNNYHRMFNMYRNAPKMTGYIIDMFLGRERIQAIKIMVKAYRPALAVEFVQTDLGYDDDSESRETCVKFLTEQGAKLSEDNSKIDCKAGLIPPVAQN